MEPHAVGLVHELAGLDAEQNVVRGGVGAGLVMDVVGRDERQPQLRGELEHAGVDGRLLGDAVVLELEEEAALAEQSRHPRRALAGGIVVLAVQERRDLALEARGERDQPLGVRGQRLVVDARLVVEALEVPDRAQLDQVPPAGLVLGQQHEVEVVAAPPAALVAAPRSQVRLHPEDRLDARLARGLVEFDRAEEVPVIGQGQGAHAHLRRRPHERVEAVRAVEERVLRVRMEMHEGHQRRGRGTGSAGAPREGTISPRAHPARRTSKVTPARKRTHRKARVRAHEKSAPSPAGHPV